MGLIYFVVYLSLAHRLQAEPCPTPCPTDFVYRQRKLVKKIGDKLRTLVDLSLSVLQGFPHKGVSSSEFQKRLSSGISLAFISWLPSIQFHSLATGFTSSQGFISGTFIVPSNQLSVSSSFKRNGILGVLSSDLELALLSGISGTYTIGGLLIGLGAGGFTGTGMNLVYDRASLSLLLESSLKGEGILLSSKILFGISDGICSLLNEGVVSLGLIKGVPFQPPVALSLPMVATLS